MITLQLGRWCHKAGWLFIHERVYTNTGKWTPVCITKFRHIGSVPALPPASPKNDPISDRILWFLLNAVVRRIARRYRGADLQSHVYVGGTRYIYEIRVQKGGEYGGEES